MVHIGGQDRRFRRRQNRRGIHDDDTVGIARRQFAAQIGHLAAGNQFRGVDAGIAGKDHRQVGDLGAAVQDIGNLLDLATQQFRKPFRRGRNEHIANRRADDVGINQQYLQTAFGRQAQRQVDGGKGLAFARAASS